MFRRQHIGFIFQKSNLIPFLSAEENVRIAMELNGDSRRAAAKRSMELLDYLGVADRAKNPGEYIEVSESGQDEESGKTAYRSRYQQLTMTTRN